MKASAQTEWGHGSEPLSHGARSLLLVPVTLHGKLSLSLFFSLSPSPHIAQAEISLRGRPVKSTEVHQRNLRESSKSVFYRCAGQEKPV